METQTSWDRKKKAARVWERMEKTVRSLTQGKPASGRRPQARRKAGTVGGVGSGTGTE